MVTAEEFFRQKLKEQSPIREVITLSQELITAEQGMRWGYEYTKLNAIDIIKKLSKTEAAYQHNIKYVFPQYNIK